MLSWVAVYIPTFVAIFHKYISFFQLGSIFKQRRWPLPNNLLILSFLSLKSRWLTEKYWSQNEFVLAIVSLRDKQPKNLL